MLLQLAAPLSGDDLHESDPLLDRLVDDGAKGTVDIAPLVVDVVKIEFELHAWRSTPIRPRLPNLVGEPNRSDGGYRSIMERAEGGTGRVVVLNGGSCAGKTTLARALQSALPDPWLLFGIDLLIWTLPPEMVDHPDGLSFRDGVITRGHAFLSLYAGFRMAIAALAEGGVSVLLDDVMLDGTADQQRWDAVLSGLDVCWIGVRCPPDVAAAREAERMSRPPGIARQQATTVHQDVRYDLEVDSDTMDLAQEIGAIAEHLRERWYLRVSSNFNRISPLPVAPAWTPGSSLGPPSWER